MLGTDLVILDKHIHAGVKLIYPRDGPGHSLPARFAREKYHPRRCRDSNSGDL